MNTSLKDVQEIQSADSFPDIDSVEPGTDNTLNRSTVDLGQVPNEPFKKPQLIIGPQRGKQSKCLNKPYKLLDDFKLADPGLEVQTANENKDSTEIDIPQIRTQSDSSEQLRPPLPYKEPTWGGFPQQEYKLEEVKNGTIIKTIDLTSRSFFVFGRLEHCDIPMLHPTVSRYHAVLQYRAEADETNEPGFYIYDLGSSLGTLVNKQKLRPKTFVRVKVGYVMKIACSTRLFVLQGPSDDEEPESDLSVTELRQQYKDKLAALEAEKARLEEEEEARIKMEEEKGIDWGMGEDADEETDLTENPYASTQNEELYLDDPKKTLRGWFEREGEELVYDVEEKGFGHYICRIELPVENGGGGTLVAEASVKGKKKEAVAQAALEACRLLDRQGLLRTATHESKKRAAKDWEAVDFYDSDEDNFLDRTGQIEKKRQQRMAQSGKLERKVETYDTLMEKYKVTIKELEESEEKLNEMLMLATQKDRGKEDEDELDAYMSSLNQTPADKIAVKKMKDEVARLRAEEGRVRSLVDLARPAELPSLEPTKKCNKKKELKMHQGLVGKKIVKKRHHQETVLPTQTTQQQPASEFQEEFDEDEESPVSQQTKKDENQIKTEVVKKKKRNRNDTRNRTFKRQSQLTKHTDAEDYSNCTWAPPIGQTGDGRTSLNDKLGY